MPLEEISNRQTAATRTYVKRPTHRPPAPPKRKAEISPDECNNNVSKKRVMTDVENVYGGMVGFVECKKDKAVAATMNIRKHANFHRDCMKRRHEDPSYALVNPFLNSRKRTLKSIKTDSEIECLDALQNLSLASAKTAGVPPGVRDYDRELLHDENHVSVYAMDIFNYLKSREAKFPVTDYMPQQEVLTSVMRALLVDWMVGVQEDFKLPHETLYLAVKYADLFFCKVSVKRDEIQLVGCASLFLATKFEERLNLTIANFTFVCDDMYTKEELKEMEVLILAKLGGEMGIPVSYSFLRRYAGCAGTDVQTLSLARYILEYSLMSYEAALQPASKMAAASLYLAMLMMGRGEKWTPTLIYYSGYTLEEFKDNVYLLNNFLHTKLSRSDIEMIKKKYSGKMYYYAAKIPLVDWI